MTKKPTKNPSRRELNEAVGNLFQGLKYFGEKLQFLEDYITSVEKALDLYTKFKKDDSEFMVYIKKYQDDLKNENEKKLEKEEKDK